MPSLWSTKVEILQGNISQRERSTKTVCEKVKVVKVPGRKNKHKVFMYALSTCVWCKKTKQFLKGNDIEYEYVDVDLCNEKDREKISKDIQRGGALSYPTLIIDDKTRISGFRKDEIKEALEI